MRFVLVYLFSLLCSCSAGRKSISERPLVDATRSDSATAVEIRDVSQPEPAKEFYVKSKDLIVKPQRKKNSTGSLSAVEDARSYILPATLPIAVGSILEIKVSSNRFEEAAGSLADGASPGDGKAAQVEDALMKALPNLEPATDKDKPTLIKSFKAHVIDIRDNGDVVVAYHRRSIRADQAADLMIKAVVPYNALTDRDNITTTRLEGVSLRESADGEIIERLSSNWEDEYTLRMSGFDEAKSKSALALEEQRMQLKDAKDKVVAQIKSLGSERNTMSKERQEMLDKKKKDEEKIAEMQAKLKEQEEEIDQLKPKEDDDEAKLAEDGEKVKTETKAQKLAPKVAANSAAAKAKAADKGDKIEEDGESAAKPATAKKNAGGAKK